MKWQKIFTPSIYVKKGYLKKVNKSKKKIISHHSKQLYKLLN